MTVWAAETFAHGHWHTARGGLDKADAIDLAETLARLGERARIAEYSDEEGTSAINAMDIYSETASDTKDA
jgi:hypothetical protein